MWPFKKKESAFDRTLTLSRALTELSSIGIALAPGVTIDDLLPSLDGDLHAPVDKLHLLCVLGSEAECSDAGLLSHDIWHLDAECIEDHGDYARLAERFAVLGAPELQITDLVDYVDIESKIAWLEFKVSKQKIHWDLEVQDDWMDPGLYSRFQQLLSAKGSRRFMICALGQDSLVLCGDEAKRLAISRFTGLQFQWQ